MSCTCGLAIDESECCDRVRSSGAGLGSTAEQLMRARYTSYVHHDARFLLESWHPATRPDTITFDRDLEWLGLEVVATEGGSPFDSSGVVEFRARFSRGGEHLELHETSRFTKVDGRWVYVDGE